MGKNIKRLATAMIVHVDFFFFFGGSMEIKAWLKLKILSFASLMGMRLNKNLSPSGDSALHFDSSHATHTPTVMTRTIFVNR